MSLDAKAAARAVSAAAPARLARVRRGSLAVLVLVVLEFGIGMYVNLYVTIPRADHGHSVGSGALVVLVQAVMARHPAATAASAAGLFALAFASVAGASFTSSGGPADSMAMSVFTGVGLLCYAANLYLLPPPGRRG